MYVGASPYPGASVTSVIPVITHARSAGRAICDPGIPRRSPPVHREMAHSSTPTNTASPLVAELDVAQGQVLAVAGEPVPLAGEQELLTARGACLVVSAKAFACSASHPTCFPQCSHASNPTRSGSTPAHRP